jgi:CheY-like chemotaxis protein
MAPLRILLAEDNKINQKFAVALLHKAGHHVTVAMNGLEAVDAMRHDDFDIVLMDVQMPELDGVGATREIRALPAPKGKVPILAMTANAMPGAKSEYLAAGMDDYIPKPVQPELLFSKLLQYRGKGPAVVAAAAPQAEPVLFDRGKIAALTDSLGDDEVQGFMTLFVQDSAAHLDAIEAAVGRSDLTAVAREAHNLVSTAGNIGAMRVSAIARELEQAARRHAAADARAAADGLRAAHAQTLAEIEDWRSRPGQRQMA